jgi:hypothetical protein
MRKKYCCGENRDTITRYYLDQAGNGLQIYHGSRGQRGHGIGSVLGGLFRSALPMLKRIGGQIVRGGAGIAKDMLEGQSFSDSARKRTAQGISNLLDEGPVSEQSGSGTRRRSLKRKRALKSIIKKFKKRKKTSRDIFN